MKISYNWLKQYIDFDINPEELADILTSTGLEVEGIEKFESVKGGLKGVLIGEVITCEKHPDADKLYVCKVTVGSDELLNIVCGAPNVSKGQKVAVATVGSTIYPSNSEEGFKIKKAKIRGVESFGMICAEDELGLGDSHDGILVLGNDAIVGEKASDFFIIENDTVFEIGLTPNRTDAMSHIGVARDIIAFLHNRDGVKYDLKWPDTDNFVVDNNNLPVSINIENPNACPRYTGLTMNNVKVQESPQWLKNRLNAVGVRTINNIVDITNWVLMETGHPLHAFDYKEIYGHTVEIKTLPEAAPFTTLDGIERKLSSEDLMICNKENPMCIAGVFGGENSGVTFNSKQIFLESAMFDPVSIRKSAKRHTLSTDASFRFERGADTEITIYAIKRAAMLIKEIAGGEVSSEIIDEYPLVQKRAVVDLRFNRVNLIAGKTIENERVINILTDLGFVVLEKKQTHLKLEVPLFRADITREIDVIEEVLRIYSYNQIEIPNQIAVSFPHQSKSEKLNLKERVANFMSDNGFYEAWSNSLTNKDYAGLITELPAEESVEIFNPLSSEMSLMRQSLVFGLLEMVAFNNNRQVEDVRAFEIGKSYKKNSGVAVNSDVRKRFAEERKIGVILSGKQSPELWYEKQRDVTVFDLKDVLFALMKRCGIDLHSVELSEKVSSTFDGGLKIVYKDKTIGEIGVVTNSLIKHFNIDDDCFYGELYWAALEKASLSKDIVFKPLPKFPSVRRDLALVVDKTVKFAEIERLAFQVEKKLLKKVNLFDVYEGVQLPDDKRSYAVSFILQDDLKTLTDKQIDKIVHRLIAIFEEKTGAKLR